jgi:predicted TIM-barrel fold metal-dependent hydrolase
MARDFIVTADAHMVEPSDLFKTRLPKHLRDRAAWEEQFDIDPIVQGGYSEFMHWHAPGFEGWTISRYRHADGTANNGDPAKILDDLDFDGVDAALLHPQTALFVLYTHDDHELSMAHARVYNDYLAENLLQYKDRLRPTCPIPLTDVPDAVAEIHRVANLGLGALLLPSSPPKPYYSPDYEPVWQAANEVGLPIFIHTSTGGNKASDAVSPTLATVARMSEMANLPMTRELAAERMINQSLLSPIEPGKIVCELIAGGVPERYPNLHFGLIEFGGFWIASLLGSMDKAWVTGIGQDADWWLGYWDKGVSKDEQAKMSRLFRLNDSWQQPLKPSEYVKRQFHFGFQDDPTAVACRDIVGVQTLLWGNDYPHAEGTYNGGRGPHSPQLIKQLFAGVPDDQRKAILGGTLAGLVGFEPAKVTA